ncbi:MULTISPECIES: hypothetical protein [unclassified Nostoc]|uniref:hypothetical protein n=1 Tax=unclassified Nostoc TaxID=2593658 RepID=UPI00167BB099|nr:hypothetical protein [Nostoc sp. 'Peltigera membranacea cyanobiont' 232]
MVYHLKFISCFDERSPTHYGDLAIAFFSHTIALFNEPQRRREHRGRRERSH